MKESEPPPAGFSCPYRDACPHLGGLSTSWVKLRHNSLSGSECHYEYVIGQLHEELAQEKRQNGAREQEIGQLKAQVQALHRSQFKGRSKPKLPKDPAAPPKKRGAPKGHPAWTRPKPKQMDLFVDVPAPQECPNCRCTQLQSSSGVREHVQEDIVLQPRVATTCFVHQLAHCPQCDCEVLAAGPGELLGSYIGPAAKATALYLRYELHVPDRKISRFFQDFFGLKFVPASACGFERQAVRRGQPLYADLLDKLRALPVAHADETSWRHDGQPYWVWYGGNDDLAVFLFDAHRTTEAA
jgi:transposase